MPQKLNERAGAHGPILILILPYYRLVEEGSLFGRCLAPLDLGGRRGEEGSPFGRCRAPLDLGVGGGLGVWGLGLASLGRTGLKSSVSLRST